MYKMHIFHTFDKNGRKNRGKNLKNLWNKGLKKK